MPGCAACAAACGRTGDYDMAQLWDAQEDIRSLKSLILFGVRGMAAYAHHAMVLGYADETVNRFFAKALFAVGEDWDMEQLLPIVMEVGEKTSGAWRFWTGPTPKATARPRRSRFR